MLFYITQFPTLYEHRCQRPTHTVIHKCNSSMFWTILWIATILPAILAACTQEDTQNANQSTKCKIGKCNISLGATNNYCSQCSAAADYFIDGECIADNRDSACTHQDEQNGTCKSCAASHFLYKGDAIKSITHLGALFVQMLPDRLTQGPVTCVQSGSSKLWSLQLLNKHALLVMKLRLWMESQELLTVSHANPLQPPGLMLLP